MTVEFPKSGPLRPPTVSQGDDKALSATTMQVLNFVCTACMLYIMAGCLLMVVPPPKKKKAG